MFNKKRFIKKLDNIIKEYHSDPSVDISKKLNELREQVYKSNIDDNSNRPKYILEAIRLIELAWDLFQKLNK